MDSDARQHLRRVSERVLAMWELNQRVVAHRTGVMADYRAAAADFDAAAVEVPLAGEHAWTVLPLGPDDEPALGALLRARSLPTLDPVELDLVRRLHRYAQPLRETVRVLTGWRRFFSGRRAKDKARDAAKELTTLHDDVRATRLVGRLPGLAEDGGTPSVLVTDALEASIGLGADVQPHAAAQALVPVSDLAGIRSAVATLLIALHTEMEFRDAARRACEDIRLAEARAVLADMPVQAIREASRERIPIGALVNQGIRTVLEVHARLPDLEQFPGVGQMSANRIRAAATTLWDTTYDTTPVHIDAVARPAHTTALLSRLAAWNGVRTSTDPAADLARAEAMNRVLEAVGPGDTELAVFCVGEHTVAELGEELATVAQRAEAARIPAVADLPDDPWTDFLARPAHYYALLSELGFLSEHGGKFSGDVPSDVVDSIRAFELNTTYLNASLRGYQDFAAKFALVQERVVIGDEMGLGKTVEALAALAHLRAQGETHFLVVSPASVVTNWVREVPVHTQLAVHRLHGQGRREALEEWRRDGGVAVTSFGTLRWVVRQELPLERMGCVVVDEAHYIKNPDAKRSRRTAEILGQVPRVLLMTGTPLANRLDEFRALVGHARPDLLDDLGEQPTAHEFREAVAPVYLRRNQEDVLTELPELVEVDDWVPMSPADQNVYRRAVEDGNFMAMRQAACTQGEASGKLRRLLEIVAEAEDNGRRVIIYSHFRAVLAQVAALLPGPVFGPLTGSIPPNERQAVIDRFAAAPGGAALVAQIVAAGVGLNIQAASVVVICEPQLTPTTEWQAIARAHRMGQLQTVQVHRLLSDEGVDERITEILAEKRAVFDDFARVSELAHSAPEAFDITEAELARQVVAAERERLLG